MKTLLFDLLVTQPNGISKFHGGGEYVKTLFKKLVQYSDSVNLIVFYDFDKFFDESIKKLIEENHIEVYDIKDHKCAELRALLDKSDILVCGLSEPIIDMDIPKKVKVVTIYHGIRALEKPIDSTSHLYSDNLITSVKDLIRYLAVEKYRKYEKKKLSKAFKKSDYLVGASNSAVSSVRVFLPEIKKEKLLLAYAPIKCAEECKEIKSERTILMLGGDRWIKNVYRGMMAIDNLFNNSLLNGYKVKVVGKVSNKIKRRMKNLDNFSFLDYVEASELESLYSSCDILFYPTLNEGFGYPPLEAMKYGKTCVVSSVSSLPEIYGESVYYCNPYDTNEMMARILFASENKLEKKSLIDKYESLVKKSDESIENLCRFLIEL